ncbi:MAG: PHP domain-containing protein [Gemmataceae bacterium]|nr:PHP domain-containing protein [Gemmataceae bacterium]
MPSRQPFTSLCQTLARPRSHGRVDLHIHTTFSDGTYRPAQVVELARRSGLAAVAITDHDTLAGIAAAQKAATDGLEIIPGVEITAEYQGRELHVLGYFVRLDDAPLTQALAELQARRAERFHEMIERLRALGVAVERDPISSVHEGTTLGRRHIAELLVKARKAANVREAFQRWLGDGGRVAVPKQRLPVAVAAALVRQAGGVAAWAHPPYDACTDALAGLQRLGIQAVEVDYPGSTARRGRELRGWARQLGMAVTGGSDCHGPDEPRRTLGSCSVTPAELETLRRLQP